MVLSGIEFGGLGFRDSRFWGFGVSGLGGWGFVWVSGLGFGGLGFGVSGLEFEGFGFGV